MPTLIVHELEEFRRLRDWTYQQLADAIEALTQRKRDADCWRRICLGLTPRPHARTLDILDEYLGKMKKRAARAEARRRRVS